MSAASPLATLQDGAVVTVRLTPRGGRDAIDGVAQDDAGRAFLKVRVSAAAESGKANAALLALLARELALPLRALALASGATQRVKRVRIAGDPVTINAAFARRMGAE